MNYKRIYFQLIKNGQRNREGNFEKHHIIPKSIWSDEAVQRELNNGIISVESKTNWVDLTLREHYICHLILVKMCKIISSNSYQRMLYALNMMNSRGNSKKYEFFKNEFIKALSNKMKGLPSRAKGCKWSDKAKRERSELYKGKTYEERYGESKAKELKEIRSKRFSKNWENLDCRKRMSEGGRYKRTKEIIDKQNKNKIGRKLTEAQKQKVKEFMLDDKRNPNVKQEHYWFKNINTGETIYARRLDMDKKGCNNIHKVIRGEQKENKGWILFQPE